MGTPVFTYTTTIGAPDLDPMTLPPAGHWARAKKPTSIVILGAGSVYVVGEGDLPAQAAQAWHKLVALGGAISYEKEIRFIAGTGNATPSTALEIILGWER